MTETLLTALYQMEEYFQSGGVVMLPLAAVSLVMWMLIVNRVLYFRRLHRKNMGSRTAWEHIHENRMPDPKQYRGAVSLLVAEFMRNRKGDPEVDRYILDESVLRINRSLEDYLSLIGSLAAVAPLLGLLGTVIGMLITFDVISMFGTGNAKALAGGISEALITTQTGLLVAIPGMYMKGFLDKRAQNLKQRNTIIGYYLRR
ncbi:MAG: MotA/TolQ/ExbB proton channel family protein, partial [Desulfohalobiaceae bacterium]